MKPTRRVTFRDFLVFQLKLWLDGFKDVTVIALSSGAMFLDFIAGRGRRPRMFYSVVRASEAGSDSRIPPTAGSAAATCRGHGPG